MTAFDGLDPVLDVPGAFAEFVRTSFATRVGPGFSLVLSGGPTARACYERLALEPGDIDWSLVTIYMGDERLVPADDPAANQRLVREALLDRVGPAVFHPMPTDGEPEACAAAYQAVVAEVLATSGFDLIHLGLGPDGHTASLFPGSPTLVAGPGQLVVPTTDPNGINPHPRLTLTLPAINQARRVVFTVVGESKRAAVAALRAGEDLPAARVEAEARWLIDPAAFGQPVGPAASGWPAAPSGPRSASDRSPIPDPSAQEVPSP
jgi:6-phosphogluconolactonase